MKTAPLISLGVLCNYVCTIKIDKKDIPVHKNGQEIIKCTRNKQIRMWEVLLKTKQSEAVENKNLDHTTKPELSQYLHAALFRPTAAIILKETKKGFLKTCPGPQKISSRSILKNQGKQQLDTCTWEDKDYNQQEKNLQIQTCNTRAKKM